MVAKGQLIPDLCMAASGACQCLYVCAAQQVQDEERKEHIQLHSKVKSYLEGTLILAKTTVSANRDSIMTFNVHTGRVTL